MRKLVLFLALLVFSIGVSAASAAESQKQGDSQINWLASMDQAVEQAKAQNKPILVDFFNPE
jgi:thiol:disulfide interchange protein